MFPEKSNVTVTKLNQKFKASDIFYCFSKKSLYNFVRRKLVENSVLWQLSINFTAFHCSLKNNCCLITVFKMWPRKAAKLVMIVTE